MKKTLSVVIPAYKRPVLLDKSIDSIFNSSRNYPVEILVMDDSLGSENDWVYKKYNDRGENLRVIKNSRNLGIDANICSCIENAITDYVWLMGEDDLMRERGISAAMAVIDEGGAVPFIYANYSYITADQKKVLREKSVEISGKDIDFAIFFEKYLWSAGFIGGCIIHRNSFLATNYRDFISTYFAHVAGICLSSRGKKIAVIAEAQVCNRVGDASTFTWSADFHGVFQGWRKMLAMLRPEFGTEAYMKSYSSHVRAHGYLGFKFLASKKADGLLARSDIAMLVAGNVSFAERCRIQLVAIFIPSAACKLLRSIYADARRMKLATLNLLER